MKIKRLFILTSLAVFISTIPVAAQTVTSCDLDTNCDTCFKIDSLYKNESNYSLQEIQTTALKASIHYGIGSNITNAQYICSVPFSESLIYNLHIIGLDSSWPKYTIENEEMHAYIAKYEESNAIQYREDINEIYMFVEQVKIATFNMNVEEKIAYIQNLLNQKFDYDYEIDFSYKLNDTLKSGKGVCTGYSNWFYLLCINLGIKSECVGTSEHMFNRVWIDNQWKYIDTTWNDSIGSNTWFLLTESQLDSNHNMFDYFK